MSSLQNIGVPVIFENDQFVVLDKPAGLLSIPDRTQSQVSLKDKLVAAYGNIYTVHRLDRDTSGVIVFARDAGTHHWLSQQFEGREVEKYYLGLVKGTLSAGSGIIDAPIKESAVHRGTMVIHRQGKPSQTGYEVLETCGPYQLVQFRLFTGRTHQIRVHAKHLGSPLLCDPVYGDGKPFLLSMIKKKYKLSIAAEAEKPILDRVALHASRLVFTDPSGKSFDFTADMPKDMRAAWMQMKKQLQGKGHGLSPAG